MMGWGNAQNPYASREYFPQMVKNNSNKVCPFTTTTNVTCQRATFEDNYLHVYVKVPPELFPGLSVSQWKLLLADRIRFNFGINSYINPLYEGASDIGAGLVYHIQIKESDRFFNIRYSPTELKKFIAARNTAPYQSITKWQARLSIFNNNAFENSTKPENSYFRQDSAVVLNDADTYFYTVFSDAYFDSISYSVEDIREQVEMGILLEPARYEGVVKSEYALYYWFYNPDHTDCVKMEIPYKELKDIWNHANRLVLADDAFMQRYMVQYAKELKLFARDEKLEDDILDVDVHFENGYTNFVFTVVDDSHFLELSPRDAELLKQSMLPVLKQDIFNEDDSPEVYGDTVVTPELFYRYMKGFRYYYIGEKSRKTIEFTLPLEEIMAASDMEMPADEDYETLIARNYVLEEYKQLVKEFSNACPVQQGILTFTDAVYQDNYLQVYATMDSTAMARNDLDQFREIMSLQLSTSYDAVLFTKLVELGSGVVFHFQFYDTLAEIQYTPQELKDLYANMDDSLVLKKQAEALLELFVQNMNKDCPRFEEGFGTVDSFVVSNQHLIINFTLIEEMTDPFFMQGKDNIKELYRMQYMRGNPADMALLKMCIDAGCGICYRFSERERVYTGKKAKKRHRSPRMIKVCFPVEEIRQILGDE